MRTFLVGCLALFSLAWNALQPSALETPQATPVVSENAASAPRLVVLLRHAEADETDPNHRDPGLSSAGRARAEALKRLLQESRAQFLIASTYRRTQETLAPLAKHLDLEVESVDPKQAETLVNRLQALPPGAVAVVCGHSNTVPDLVTRLGGNPTGIDPDSSQGSVLPHSAHDRLYLVWLPATLPAGAPAVNCTLELRVGS